jgi:hypothetical protein
MEKMTFFTIFLYCSLQKAKTRHHWPKFASNNPRLGRNKFAPSSILVINKFRIEGVPTWLNMQVVISAHSGHVYVCICNPPYCPRLLYHPTTYANQRFHVSALFLASARARLSHFYQWGKVSAPRRAALYYLSRTPVADSFG